MKKEPASFKERMQAKYQEAKDYVMDYTAPEPQGVYSVFNFLPNTKNYLYAGICFLVSLAFFVLSIVALPMLILSPAKFVMFFTLAIMTFITSMALMKGVRVYVKSLFAIKNLPATTVLTISLLYSLYFSWYGSYLWCMLFCFLEVNSIMYFFFKTSAVSVNQIRWLGTGFMNWFGISV